LNEIANVIMGQSPESCYYNDNKNGLPFHQGAGSYGDFYLIDGIYSTEGLRIAEPGSIIFSVRAPVGKLNITINKILL
ncbi:MAG: restriction endonuclease subunit S, partial [Bacteroidales bacterium]|nr:restriction endonuclease subunit S [Bacteroidales bacterium]